MQHYTNLEDLFKALKQRTIQHKSFVLWKL